jgi:chromosome segregation ATPase
MMGKSKWYINSKASSEKEVVATVKKLNIQTDNLCQFLPQDKVHDFSKMNSKELLTRTVEAVGDTELKEDHDMLKSLQSELTKNQDTKAKKEHRLSDLKLNCEMLEQAVKNYEARAKIEKKLKLLEKKREWCLVDEAKEDANEAQSVCDEAARKVQAAEAELLPLKEEIKAIEREKGLLTAKEKELSSKCRHGVHKALTLSIRIEEIEPKIEELEHKYQKIVDCEQDKKRQLNLIEDELETLKEEYCEAEEKSGEKNDMLEQKCKLLQKEMDIVHGQQSQLNEQIHEMSYECKGLDGKIKHLRKVQEDLLSVKRQKLDTLKNSLPNGKDAVKAMEWLSQNRDQFQGRVYDPMLMCIDVTEADKYAKYIETCIPPKELVAFAVEKSDDANKLMKQFRDTMRLKVNVVQVEPCADPDHMQAKSGEFSAADQQKYEFKGFVKDMFTCPGPIKAYLCKLYGLQNIPVFGAKAENYLTDLVNEFRKFFTGEMRHAVMVSRYNMSKSTISSTINTFNLLKISLDKAKINETKCDLTMAEGQYQKLSVDLEREKENLQEVWRELEAKKQEVKAIQQKLHYKKVLKGRLSAKQGQLAESRKSMRPVDLKKEEEVLNKNKVKLVDETVALSEELANLVTGLSVSKIKVELMKLSLSPLFTKEDNLKHDFEEQQIEMADLKVVLGEERETLRQSKDAYTNQLKAAQQISEDKGKSRYQGNKPPRELVEAWYSEEIVNIGSEEARVQMHEAEGELDCLDAIDPKAVREHRELKVDIEALEAELDHWEVQVEEKQLNINTIRERWIVRLEALVSRISEQFSTFFEHMGFAGCVQLNKGKHEDDFGNYGFDVLVKFRNKLPLQRLDPFKQSGGERSVSTALYMMALQSMTKVPFRCVDEINQGMDERNERRVFDLLIETSVRANSAQYFLLTPKLLRNLNYERGVTVLIVHNGTEMCSDEKWDVKNFIRNAKSTRTG